MKACLRFAPMIGARQGELGEAEASALSEHLAACEECQARLADDAALSGLVAQALLDEANRRDFSTFADGVLERLEPAPLRSRLAAWVRRHRMATAAAALAPALAAITLLVYLGRGAAPEPFVQVTAEGRTATLLETGDGPIVLLGDEEPEGS